MLSTAVSSHQNETLQPHLVHREPWALRRQIQLAHSTCKSGTIRVPYCIARHALPVPGARLCFSLGNEPRLVAGTQSSHAVLTLSETCVVGAFCSHR